MSSTARWLVAEWGANLRSALEYRASFAMQAGFMLLNNLVFLAFWGVMMARFQDVGGWKLQDVALCFGTCASGFGLAALLFGGAFELAPMVARGRLDGWMLRSRPVLVQALISRMRTSGAGDLATGPVLLIATGTLEPRQVALFLLGTLSAGAVIVAFLVLLGSITFWAGPTDDLANHGLMAVLSFSFYPPGIHGRVARMLLHVVVPAGLMTWMPVGLLREFSWERLALLLLGVGAFGLAAVTAWTLGLRRYESGNLTLAAGD